MAQDDTIVMLAIFLVLLANIHPPKPIQILLMSMVNLEKCHVSGQSREVFVGTIHAVFSITCLDKQSKE
jgi:hypothetical protein